MVAFQTIYGLDVIPYLDDIARLRITIFREFPYLYEGSLAYEKEYLAKFSRSKESVTILAKDQEEVIGVFTGLPLHLEDETITRSIPQEKLLDSFYFSELLLLKAYRKQGIGKNLLQQMETIIKQKSVYQRIVFASILREENHPLKPLEYYSMDNAWKKYGYSKTTDTCQILWKEINQSEETPKTLAIWEKVL